MEFRPFVVLAATGEEMPVQIVLAQDDDLQVTRGILHGRQTGRRNSWRNLRWKNTLSKLPMEN